MSLLDIPEKGLPLVRKTDSKSELHAKAPQVMRLNLEEKDRDNILKCLHNNEKVRVKFGKRQHLTYGDKSLQLYAQPEPGRSELYMSKEQNKDGLYFTGELSHRLESQEAQKVIDGADSALLKLKENMRAIGESKASNEARLVNDRPAFGHRKTPSKSSAHLSPFPTQRLMNSRPGSPALGGFSASNTPRLTPTSNTLAGATLSEEDQVKLAAMRTPLIHMLAVGPHTVKEVCSRMHCPRELCKRLLQRIGDEMKSEPGKYELRDKLYKELDIFKFPYPSKDVRQKVVDRAVTAFDRMRVTRKDEAWQKLLPKEDRGKGIVLSRTNLEGVPKVLPPKAADSDAEGKKAGPDRGRPNTETKKPIARASSQHSTTSKPSSTDSEESKSAKAKPEAPRPTQTVPKPARTGMSQKMEKTKFKSSEYIQDSDDDVSMSDVPLAEKKAKNETRPKIPVQAQPKPSTAVSSQPSNKQREPDQTARSIVRRKEEGKDRPGLNRPRTDSSPRKPSPLGSSPPTNATDNDTSSRTSRSSNDISSKISASSATTAAPRPPDKSSKPASQSVIAGKTDKPVTNGVKRKADVHEDGVQSKRHQASAPVDSGRGRPQEPRPKVSRPAPVQDNNRKLTSSQPNGGSLGGSSSGSASPPDREQLVQKAREFQSKYETYRAFYETVSNMGTKAGPDDMEKLRRMQARIRDLKKEIWRESEGV